MERTQQLHNICYHLQYNNRKAYGAGYTQNIERAHSPYELSYTIFYFYSVRNKYFADVNAADDNNKRLRETICCGESENVHTTHIQIPYMRKINQQ